MQIMNYTGSNDGDDGRNKCYLDREKLECRDTPGAMVVTGKVVVVAGCVVEVASCAVVVAGAVVVVGASVAVVVVGAAVVVAVDGAGLVVVGCTADVVLPETENSKLCIKNTQTTTRGGRPRKLLCSVEC